MHLILENVLSIYIYINIHQYIRYKTSIFIIFMFIPFMIIIYRKCEMSYPCILVASQILFNR